MEVTMNEEINTTDIPEEDIYTYEADDEPVKDRDLYSDFTGEVLSGTCKKETTVSSGKSEPVSSPDAAGSVPAQAQEPQSSEQHSAQQPENEEYEVSGSPMHLKVHRIYFVNTVISMITLCMTAAAVFTGYAYIHNLEQQLGLERNRIADLEEKEASDKGTAEGEYVDAVSLIDEEAVYEPDTPVTDMVEIDKGKILTYDSYVGYSWFPVLSGIKTNQYNNDNFRRNSEGRMEYYSNGELSSYFGIDVSSHQGDINWDAVRSDGVEFAMLRIGVRGYAEEGNIKLDDKFEQNFEGARSAGVDLGVYFYSQAISVEEAEEEAQFILDNLKGRKLEYPIVFDWEPVDTYDPEVPPRTEDVMPGTLTLCAQAFCEKIKDAGYDAMIYTNKKMAYIKYDLRMLESYPKWLALYTDEMTYYYDFDMWQYGFGSVDGIEGDVDLNIAIIR